MKKIILTISLSIFVLSMYLIIHTQESIAGKASTVGFVKVARGEVKLERNKKSKKVKKSMKLLEGDTITTSAKALLTMYAKDGSIYTIPENSSVVLESYKANKEKSKRNASFKLLFGKIRGAVTQIKTKKPNVIVKTPSAVAGIRGTDMFVEIAKGKDKENATNIACITGICLAGSIKNKKKASLMDKIANLFEGTAFAAKTSMEMIGIPKGTSVNIKKGMSLEGILKSARKISSRTMRAIKSNSPTTDKEHSDALTNNALEIDATDSSNMKSDIDTDKGDEVLAADKVSKLEQLKPAEIKQILGTAKVTIIIDLSETM